MEMRRSDFSRLDIIRTEEDLMGKKLKKYDRFLYGQSMFTQMESKGVGDEISYYEVVDELDNGNILYEVKYDIMEKD